MKEQIEFGTAGQGECREAAGTKRCELEPAECHRIERAHGLAPAFRPRECELDRESHVRERRLHDR